MNSFMIGQYGKFDEQKYLRDFQPSFYGVKLIVKENPHVKVMFEHRSDMISDEQLARCYTWIDELVNNRRSSM